MHTRGVWEAEVYRYRNVSSDSSFYRDRELPRGPYDADAKGRLKLELHSSSKWTYSGRQSRWSDRQSWTLEERLPHLFREIEERIVEADHAAERARIAAEKAAEAARQAAVERERTWQVLMRQAEVRLVEAHRAAQLRAQADAWHQAESLRRYCDAVGAAYGDRLETAERLTWAQTHILSLDPLTEPPTMPAAPEASPDALQAPLPEGWSAPGPEYGHR